MRALAGIARLFLSKLRLDARQLADARAARRKDSSSNPGVDIALPGHFVPTDIYACEGRTAEAAKEAAEGRRFASRITTQ